MVLRNHSQKWPWFSHPVRATRMGKRQAEEVIERLEELGFVGELVRLRFGRITDEGEVKWVGGLGGEYSCCALCWPNKGKAMNGSEEPKGGNEMSAWWNAVRERVQTATDWLRTDRDQMVDRLTQFRVNAVKEARASFRNDTIDLPDVQTNLAHALDDICEALGLDQEAIRQVLGEAAYTYIYDMPAVELDAYMQQEYEKIAARRQALLAQLNELSSVKAGHIVLNCP